MRSTNQSTQPLWTEDTTQVQFNNIATLGSILDTHLRWESGKFQLLRWSQEEPPTHLRPRYGFFLLKILHSESGVSWQFWVSLYLPIKCILCKSVPTHYMLFVFIWPHPLDLHTHQPHGFFFVKFAPLWVWGVLAIYAGCLMVVLNLKSWMWHSQPSLFQGCFQNSQIVIGNFSCPPHFWNFFSIETL